MAQEIQEIPLDVPADVEQQVPETLPEVTETPAVEAKPKGRGRPKGVRDTKPRAKAKAKTLSPQRPRTPAAPKPIDRIPYTQEDDSSADEDVLHEASLMHLLRGVQQYKHSQKNQKKSLYASWFGR